MSHGLENRPLSALDMRSIIALGANLPSKAGQPRETLLRALQMIEENGGIVHARSRWYRSPAWPAGAGPDYVNGAAIVSFAGDAYDLLALLQKIESDLGRTRKAGRWDARVCDIDLIERGGAILPDPQAWQAVADAPPEAVRPTLVLPHPLMHSRAFVLVPVAEVAPDLVHPVLGRSMTALRDALPREDVAALTPLAG